MLLLPLLGLTYLFAQRYEFLDSVIPSSDSILFDSSPSLAVDAPAGPARARAAATRVIPLLEPELTAKQLHWGDPVFLRAFKEEATLELFIKHRQSGRFVLFRSYPIAKQSGTLGPKLREGDGQVPEGFYAAGRSAMKPNSTYHLAMNIGYPNALDQALKRTGSFIMIHGNQVSIGCLAMTDEKIEEIYSLCDAALQQGQSFFRIHIFPFRMHDDRLEREKTNPHYDFWQNLQEGYRLFETHGVPAETHVQNHRYQFRALLPEGTESAPAK
jgi:murein L,D-transpeptidase YafK